MAFVLRKSSPANPYSEDEVKLANALEEDRWIHFICKQCGKVGSCFNHTESSQKLVCSICHLDWTLESFFTPNPTYLALKRSK